MKNATLITVKKDEFETWEYTFELNGEKHWCPDFPSKDEAFKGAEFHITCISRGLKHEVVGGLGAVYLDS